MEAWQPRYIVDIGACVGLFVDHCLDTFPVEKIFAFEPLRANYEHLQDKYADNPRVEIFPLAVSDFNGTAKLFKKRYIHKYFGFIPHAQYDFAGNAGSSLRPDKSNVSLTRSNNVEVIQARDLFKLIGVGQVDLLKIDSEGSEYDILFDLLQTGLDQRIDRIYFEDHVRKIPGLRKSKAEFAKKIRELGIEEKFYLQGDHLTYTPLIHEKDY